MGVINDFIIGASDQKLGDKTVEKGPLYESELSTCKCRYKCKDVHVEQKAFLFNDYYNIPDVNHQSTYLLGLIQKNHILSDASRNITSKFAKKYVEPYNVVGIPSPWSYELADQDGKTVEIWNAKDLKSHLPDSD
nr:unnamed protein product [Callosobruchus analis]